MQQNSSKNHLHTFFAELFFTSKKILNYFSKFPPKIILKIKTPQQNPTELFQNRTNYKNLFIYPFKLLVNLKRVEKKQMVAQGQRYNTHSIHPTTVFFHINAPFKKNGYFS
eukprot:TRINITY_DN13319_c0_g1_i2.p3 TRINITY_DN13319_c0_g1~~TRINITY_DN13319_c0_g1_i2.p3  ORF type:complete len:111 (-),score=4.86 TRINITY_DN13319_c0_g1_i2:95-427(-)